jgi:hypothetical protein
MGRNSCNSRPPPPPPVSKYNAFQSIRRDDTFYVSFLMVIYKEKEIAVFSSAQHTGINTYTFKLAATLNGKGPTHQHQVSGSNLLTRFRILHSVQGCTLCGMSIVQTRAQTQPLRNIVEQKT